MYNVYICMHNNNHNRNPFPSPRNSSIFSLFFSFPKVNSIQLLTQIDGGNRWME